MPSSITGTGALSVSPTAYAGANSNLTQAIQTIWSKEILFQAMPVLRFEQFAVKKTELGVQPGLQINFMRYNNLGAATQLVEGVRLQTNALTASQFTITVSEHGYAVAVSELLLNASFDDVMASASRLLGRNMALYLDPHQSRRLRDNPEFIEVTKYAAPGNFMLGEIGRLYDTVFIETTQVQKATNGAGTGYTVDTTLGVTGNGNSDRYTAIFIGDNAFGHAISLPVELRDGGILDFGREHALAWYAIWGLGVITDQAIVRVETN
jgi:hypothetical protein